MEIIKWPICAVSCTYSAQTVHLFNELFKIWKFLSNKCFIVSF